MVFSRDFQYGAEYGEPGADGGLLSSPEVILPDC